jgi:MtN3 and saliva related transmembrane protein
MIHPIAAATGSTKLIGWAASAILVLTISTQIHRQWKSGTSKGVSLWLFVGQTLASVGFSIYSFLAGDVVFIFTNLVMLAAALFGLALLLWHRAKNGSAAEE